MRWTTARRGAGVVLGAALLAAAGAGSAGAQGAAADPRDALTFLSPFGTARAGDADTFDGAQVGVLVARICEQESGACTTIDHQLTGGSVIQQRERAYVVSWTGTFLPPARSFTLALELRGVGPAPPIPLGSRRFCATAPGAGQAPAIHCLGRHRAPVARTRAGRAALFFLHLARHPVTRARQLAVAGVGAIDAAPRIASRFDVSLGGVASALALGYGIGATDVARALDAIDGATPTTIAHALRSGLDASLADVAAALDEGLRLTPAQLGKVLFDVFAPSPAAAARALLEELDAASVAIAMITGAGISPAQTAAALFAAGVPPSTVARALGSARVPLADIVAALLTAGQTVGQAGRICAEALGAATPQIVAAMRLNRIPALELLESGLPAFSDRSLRGATIATGDLRAGGYPPEQIGPAVRTYYRLDVTRHTQLMNDVLPANEVFAAIWAAFPAERLRTFAVALRDVPTMRVAQILAPGAGRAPTSSSDRRGLVKLTQLLFALDFPGDPVVTSPSVTPSLGRVDPKGILHLMRRGFGLTVGEYVGAARMTTNPSVADLGIVITGEYVGTLVQDGVLALCRDGSYVLESDPRVILERAYTAPAPETIARGLKPVGVGSVDLALGFRSCGKSRATILQAIASSFNIYATASALDALDATFTTIIRLFGDAIARLAEPVVQSQIAGDDGADLTESAQTVRRRVRAGYAALILDFVIRKRITRPRGVILEPIGGPSTRDDIPRVVRSEYGVSSKELAVIARQRLRYDTSEARRALLAAGFSRADAERAVEYAYGPTDPPEDPELQPHDGSVLVAGSWGGWPDLEF